MFCEVNNDEYRLKPSLHIYSNIVRVVVIQIYQSEQVSEVEFAVHYKGKEITNGSSYESLPNNYSDRFGGVVLQIYHKVQQLKTVMTKQEEGCCRGKAQLSYQYYFVATRPPQHYGTPSRKPTCT